MSKGQKTQWTKNESPKTYLTNTTNPESPKKLLHPLNKVYSQY